MPDTYNDRLFNGNRARRFLHERRFLWLTDRLRRLNIRRADVIEIGCYDAKTISYLERSGIAVNRYIGYEADDDIDRKSTRLNSSHSLSSRMPSSA